MMKNCFFILVMALAFALTGCQEQKVDYKAQGEQYAKRLDELFQKNDTAAVIALMDSIRVVEDEIIAKADRKAINEFRSALTEVRERCTPMTTVGQMNKGVDKEQAVQDVIDDALNGAVDINTVTKTIEEANKAKKQKEASK